MRSICAGNRAFFFLRGFAITLGYVYYKHKFRDEIKSLVMAESCRACKLIAAVGKKPLCWLLM